MNDVFGKEEFSRAVQHLQSHGVALCSQTMRCRHADRRPHRSLCSTEPRFTGLHVLNLLEAAALDKVTSIAQGQASATSGHGHHLQHPRRILPAWSER